VRLLRLQPARLIILVIWVHYKVAIEDLLERFVERPAGTAWHAYKTRGGGSQKNRRTQIPLSAVYGHSHILNSMKFLNLVPLFVGFASASVLPRAAPGTRLYILVYYYPLSDDIYSLYSQSMASPDLQLRMAVLLVVQAGPP
jgi:hypothetical protein